MITPINTAPVSSVDTTAMTGSDSSRIDFEHLLRKRRRVAAGDEDRDYRLVEGVQEGEQRADQDAGAQHRQRHPEEGAQWTGAGAHGRTFEIAIEALERRRDDQEGDRNRQHAVRDDHAGICADKTHKVRKP